MAAISSGSGSTSSARQRESNQTQRIPAIPRMSRQTPWNKGLRCIEVSAYPGLYRLISSGPANIRPTRLHRAARIQTSGARAQSPHGRGPAHAAHNPERVAIYRNRAGKILPVVDTRVRRCASQAPGVRRRRRGRGPEAIRGTRNLVEPQYNGRHVLPATSPSTDS